MKKGKDDDPRESGALLDCGAEFEGKLALRGTVRIEGTFRGEIRGPGTLVIGEKGIVDATIEAGVVIVRGETRGTIRAEERIEAYAPAKIFGDLYSPVLVFGEGVVFQGISHATVENRKDAGPAAPSGEHEKNGEPLSSNE